MGLEPGSSQDQHHGRITVVTCTQNSLSQRGLESLLRDDGQVTILAATTKVAEAEAAIRQHQPAVLLLEQDTPPFSGLELSARIRASGEVATHIILMGLLAEVIDLEMALDHRIHGLLPRDKAASDCLRALRMVASGGYWLDCNTVMHSQTGLHDGSGVERDALKTNQGAAFLTSREIEVCRLLATGLRNREIARQLEISEATVKLHIHHVFTKLGVTSRTALAWLVSRWRPEH